MRATVIASVLLGVFVFVAVFGLPMLLSNTEHHVGCPLHGAGAVMCESTILEHFSIWQAMFASFLALFVFVCFGGAVVSTIPEPSLNRVRIRCRRAPARPTLLQELFSSGILNRKEPYPFC